MPTDLAAFEPGAPLHAMTMYKQWLLFQLTEWNTAKGKWEKKPIQPNGWGMPWRSAPEKLLTYADAVAALPHWPNACLGFVLSDADPFFCLDIDHCLVNGQWSEAALSLVNSFPRGVVESSASGDGLHVFGSCAPLEHASDNNALGAEFYTRYRAIALTGLIAPTQNRIDNDSTPEVIDLVGRHFYREPRQPKRDSELATVDELEKVREAIKYIDSNLPYNEWIANCMAIHAAGEEAGAEALAWEIAEEYSSLSPKYTPGYLDHKWGSFHSDGGVTLGTLFHHAKKGGYKTAAEIDVAQAFSAYLAEVPPVPVPLPPELASNDPQVIVHVEQRDSGIQYPTDYLPLFSGMAYIAALHAIWAPDGQLYDQKRFNTQFSGHQFALDQEARKCTDEPWEAYFKCRAYKFRRVKSACFRPDLPPGTILSYEGRTAINTYVPVPVPCAAGDVSLFLDHLAKVLPVERDRTILLSYLAAVVQYPGRKFSWAPLLQGWEGNGKSFFTRALERAVGLTYSHRPQAEDLGNKFNSWMYGKLLIAVEDVYVPGHKSNVIEALKPMITEDRVGIQGKGADQITAEICCNFIFNSNFRNALGAAVRGRRYCVFFTAQQSAEDVARDGMTGHYFKRLMRWAKYEGGYAAITHYLRNYAIAEEFNPAETCTVAPATSTYAEVIEEAAGPVEQELMAAIYEGRPGFVDPWISSHAVDRVLRETKLDSRVQRNKRRHLIESLGYVRHPHLPEGRTNNAVLPDGARTSLFVKKGHPLLELTGPAAIAERYSKAQQDAIKLLMPAADTSVK